MSTICCVTISRALYSTTRVSTSSILAVKASIFGGGDGDFGFDSLADEFDCFCSSPLSMSMSSLFVRRLCSMLPKSQNCASVYHRCQQSDIQQSGQQSAFTIAIASPVISMLHECFAMLSMLTHVVVVVGDLDEIASRHRRIRIRRRRRRRRSRRRCRLTKQKSSKAKRRQLEPKDTRAANTRDKRLRADERWRTSAVSPTSLIAAAVGM